MSSPSERRAQPVAATVRYAATIFMGAFLLFEIEPMIAKDILPWFGGSPAVWTTCLLFFQVMLLAGYLYAHLLGTRLTPARQALAHLGLVGACAAAMAALAIWSRSPILPGAGWISARVQLPLVRILLVLAASIGLPYFSLSATAPLLQSWFAAANRDSSPYRLYAVSNFGSLLGLIAYPFAVEPALGLRAQSDLWFVLYLAFAVGIALCALPLRALEPVPPCPVGQAAASSSRGAMALWIALPACASLLLYGATGQMTQDLAPIAFLWILPLALYLISFILCFDSDRWYRREIFQPLLAASILTNLIVVFFGARIAAGAAAIGLSPAVATVTLEIGNISVLMFSGCMVCHGETVRLRPHERDLTVFYLMLAAGGAVGGIFAVVLAPLVFREYVDFRFAIWACLLLMTIALIRDRASWLYKPARWTAPAVLAAATLPPVLIGIGVRAGIYAAVTLGIIAAAVFGTRRNDRIGPQPPSAALARGSMLIAVAAVGILYAQLTALATRNALWLSRNFYGVLRVIEEQAPDHRWVSHKLMNGQVEHGKQFFSSVYPQLRYYPTGYWGTYSGIGLVMLNIPQRSRTGNSPMRIGVVGLGVGAMAAWGRPGDYICFYELNPAVIDVATSARGYFTYLSDSTARIKIIPGDARLSMKRELADGHPQRFDVLVIDAFTGDVIPTHLLTREAMRLYLRELKPDGVLAVHISNLNFDLRPVLAENARVLKLRYGFVHADERDMVNWSSDWGLLARNDKVLGQPAIAAHLDSGPHLRRIKPWTDDYSNLFELLK